MSDYLPFAEDFLVTLDARKMKTLRLINERAKIMLEEYAEGKIEVIRKADLLRDITAPNYFVIKPNEEVNKRVEYWLSDYKRNKPRTKKVKAGAEYSRVALYRSIELCEIHEFARLEAEAKLREANEKIVGLEKQIIKLQSQLHPKITPIVRPSGGTDAT